MGNYASKIFSHHDQEGQYIQTQIKMSSIDNEDVSTPVMAKKMSADPRSATAGIPRTPIEVISTPTAASKKAPTAIPRYLQPKPYLETDVDQILPAMTPEKRMPDPRSPNVTKDRTPILVKTFQGYLSPIVKVQEGPDMLTPDSLDPRSPAMTFSRTPIQKPAPLNRSSSPIDDSADNNIKMSYCETVGLLDVPEIQALPKISTRNLEERIKSFEAENSEETPEEEEEEEVPAESCSEYSEESENEDQITVIPNLQAIARLDEVQLTSNHEDQLETIEKEEKTTENIVIPSKSKNTDGKGKIKVWRDSISPIPPPEENSEIMIVYEDETVFKSRSEVEEKKAPIINKQIKKIQKKEAKSGFDEAGADAGKNRTPLGCRSNTKSGIPTKSPQQVLRTKGLATKQQENTPPNLKRIRAKGKVMQWDADTTIVI